MLGTEIERGSFEVTATRPAPVVVVADSHSRPHPDTYRLIEREAPALILHAGDVGRLTILDELEAIAPTRAVRGNIDSSDPRIPDTWILDLTVGRARVLRVAMTHIAVYGPALRKDARQLAEREQADLVICGHSHVPLIAQQGPVVVFNPGSFGPRRFNLPITFGVFEVGERLERLRHIDCESGEPWSPPRR